MAPDPIGPPPPPKPQPFQGPSTPSAPSMGGGDQLPPSLMNSPFAKMFAQSGVPPSAKEIKQMIDNILKDVMASIKKSDDEWKAAMKKIKDAIEGNDD